MSAKDDSASAHTSTDHDQQERRSCFYCLEGWVFLGSIGHDGEEVVESVRCRKCGGTGKLQAAD